LENREDRRKIKHIGASSWRTWIKRYLSAEDAASRGSLPNKTVGEKVLLTRGWIIDAIIGSRGTDGSTDQRSHIVRPTPDGSKTIREAFAGHKKPTESAVTSLRTSERMVLIELLRRRRQDAQMRLQPEESLRRTSKERT